MLLRSGGAKTLLAENLLLKHQLMIVRRSRVKLDEEEPGQANRQVVSPCPSGVVLVHLAAAPKYGMGRAAWPERGGHQD